MKRELPQKRKLSQKWGLQFGASQVVAGVTIDSAIETAKSLNEKGLVCTVDHLGEFVSSKEEAAEATEYCVKTLEAIAESGANCNLSLKMTQLGLDIDRGFCMDNIRRILATAKNYNNFVRIDMEDHSHCQMTLDILKELRESYDNVGTVIQAYLYRSEQDIQDLKGISLRLVKGAYKESPEVAYQDIPFGNDWFGYYMRRLAERPQNVAFALKGLVSK